MSHPLSHPRFPDFPAGGGGYESYYLKATSPDGNQSVWIRNTVGKRPGAAPTGSLWFTFFERGAERPYAVKQTFSEPAPLDGPRGLIAIGDARFGLDAVTGAAQGEGRSAVWDLHVVGRSEPLLHMPEHLYRSGLMRTKLITLMPEANFDGRITVGERAIDLSGWRGMVGHNWGAQHAEQWIWLFGDGMHGGKSASVGVAWLDVVAGRVKLGPMTTPWLASGALGLDGERYRLGGIARWVTSHITPDVGRCEVRLKGRGIRIHARFEAPRETITAWRYADPDGSEHHTLNSSLAGLDLHVERKGQEPLDLRTPTRAVYEWGSRRTDHGIPVEPFPDP